MPDVGASGNYKSINKESMHHKDTTSNHTPQFDPEFLTDDVDVKPSTPITPAAIMTAAAGAKQSPVTGNTNQLNRLREVSQKIIEASKLDIVFSPAWVTCEGAPIFSRGTVNLIQGKQGSHKSRLAEHLCSLLLSKDPEASFAGFERYTKGRYNVAYIDTERSMREAFAAAVQRIRIHAGYDKKGDCPHFYPTSIKQVDRKGRLDAVKVWVEHVRNEIAKLEGSMEELFVVLDVVTDCVASFNSEEQTLALFDFLGNLCEEYDVTFLLVLHENPGTEKARGHTGTEAANKADTAMQIGYDGEDTDLIKVKFIKTRQSARPKPVYLQYSQEAHSLVSANKAAVDERIDQTRKNRHPQLVIKALEGLFGTQTEIPRQEILDAVMKTLNCTQNTADSKIKAIMSSDLEILDKQGRACLLAKSVGNGKRSVFFLTPITETPTPEPEPELPL